jgi:hypothetical protein
MAGNTQALENLTLQSMKNTIDKMNENLNLANRKFYDIISKFIEIDLTIEFRVIRYDYRDFDGEQVKIKTLNYTGNKKTLLDTICNHFKNEINKYNLTPRLKQILFKKGINYYVTNNKNDGKNYGIRLRRNQLMFYERITIIL